MNELSNSEMHDRDRDELGRFMPVGSPLSRLLDDKRIDERGCWISRIKPYSNGYVVVWVNGARRSGHRFVYEALVGPVPKHLVVDHLCRNRACLNPEHLEPVTQQVNTVRGDSPKRYLNTTHCPHGHPYTGDNLRITPRGFRRCHECAVANDLRQRARRRALHFAEAV